MSKIRHSLSDADITTEISSRRKFLRGLVMASTGAGLIALGVTAVRASGQGDSSNKNCKDGGGDSKGTDSSDGYSCVRGI